MKNPIMFIISTALFSGVIKAVVTFFPIEVNNWLIFLGGMFLGFIVWLSLFNNNRTIKNSK